MQVEQSFGKKRMLQIAFVIGFCWIFLILVHTFDPERFNNSRMRIPALLFIWLGWPGYFLQMFYEWKKNKRL